MGVRYVGSVTTWDTIMDRQKVMPTANTAVISGRLAARNDPNMSTRITSAASMPTPSAAPPPPSAASRIASPPTATVSPSPEAASAASASASASSAVPSKPAVA